MINPADIYNPFVKFLGGADINIDNFLPEHVPNYWEQSILIAKNPFVAAKFFNVYMKMFINSILAYNLKENNLDGRILGVVNAYYRCVRAQGRGTLYCHMIVQLEGALSSNEIKPKIMDQGNSNFCK
jgi:Helitron helicase-like domain at N-terminus